MCVGFPRSPQSLTEVSFWGFAASPRDSAFSLAPTGPAQALFKTASRFVRQLEIFRVYTKRDYRDGLPDKAEWGQGIIATFKSGFTQGPVGFGVDCIAQYAVRLDGGRGPSGLRLD